MNRHSISAIAALCVILSGMPVFCSETVPDLFEETREKIADNPTSLVNGMSLWVSFTEYYDSPDEMQPFLLENEVLDIDCTVVSRMLRERGLGFHVFTDGIPQPFQLEPDETMSYMHIVYPKDLIENQYRIKINPVMGKKGEELEVGISSILYPSFHPDIKRYRDYGFFHDMTYFSNILIINNEIGIEEELPIVEDRLSHVTVTQEDLSSTQKKLYLLQWGRTEDELKKEAFEKFYINGTDMESKQVFTIDDMDQIHLRMELVGYPLAEYRVSVFINHEPLGCKGEVVATEMPVQKDGKAGVFEADLDVSNLSGINTLYLLAVPRDRNQLSDGGLVPFLKTNSIALYRENELQSEERAGSEYETGDL